MYWFTLPESLIVQVPVCVKEAPGAVVPLATLKLKVSAEGEIAKEETAFMSNELAEHGRLPKELMARASRLSRVRLGVSMSR